MQSSKFIKLDVDVLLEYIYDDSNFIVEDYRIIVDTLSQTRSFSQTETTGILDSTSNNTSIQQLFSLDKSINKWGIVNSNSLENRYHFLQFQQFSGNVPFRFDKVRIHFPANYTFKDKIGFLLNIGLMNSTQQSMFNVCNYYYDKTNPSRVLEVELGVGFQFEERVWSKYIEIQIPSPYALIRDYQMLSNGVIIPKDGSIHKNLVGDDFNILSMESPIFIDFSFLTKKENVLNKVSYLTTEPFEVTIPVTPEYESLAVKIEHDADGDFFNIYGTFNSTQSDFNLFIKNAAIRGKRYYVIYDITIYEKNMKTQQVSMIQSEDFDDTILFRPIVQFSTTTATIDVLMKVVDAADSSIITRRTSYSMLQDEVSKYAKKLTKINIKDTFKPKIYNSKPDNINITTSTVGTKIEKIKVPYAVMYERYNIMVKNKTEQINDTIFYGQGQNQILLHNAKSDNFVEFVIGKGTNENGVVPFSIPENTPIFLSFRSEKKFIEVPLYYDGGKVNLVEGVLSFRILETQMPSITEIKKDGFDQFYIIMKPESGSNSVIYFGRFIISNLY